MNYAFYVSGNAGRLRKILKNKEKYLSKVKVIISDDAKNRDLENIITEDIKYILIDYLNIEYDKNITLSNQILDILKNNNIDYVFSFGDHILKGKLLEEYENKIINFHPSILPMFKGRKAIDQAIESNAFLLGCTAHFIDSGVDTGPIILQCIMNKQIFKNKDYDSVLDVQIDMLRQIIALLENHRIIVQHGEVIILDANYNKITFFPEI